MQQFQISIPFSLWYDILECVEKYIIFSPRTRVELLLCKMLRPYCNYLSRFKRINIFFVLCIWTVEFKEIEQLLVQTEINVACLLYRLYLQACPLKWLRYRLLCQLSVRTLKKLIPIAAYKSVVSTFIQLDMNCLNWRTILSTCLDRGKRRRIRVELVKSKSILN